MAAAGAFGQAMSHCAPLHHHGKKRPAESGLESEQRLSKRLDLLHLENSGHRFYVPVGAPSNVNIDAQQLRQQPPKQIAPVKEKKREKRSPADDCMQVEDTPHRVYIHDLSAELSDIESDEENPIFLPDIEKHISKIPMHILAGPELKPTKDNQLVLYNVPSSLTVPEEQDRVRRAIVEARARIREKQASPVQEIHDVSGARTPAYLDHDPDAMDIDG